MDMKEICMRFLAADSETAVQKIIDSVPEMANPKNWRPLDGRETNFNTASNQASTGGKALTELMTNMVDAVLMKRAYQEGIDPKGADAPKTMYEAVDKFIMNLRGGRIVDVDDEKQLKAFSEKNLVIGVTGAKTKKEGLPCYTFMDNGEGQAPDNFIRTFLSLSDGNKKDVPFVQGKYNMGSSGVLTYCGRKWFKLILSRRYDGKAPWGWTLLRRRPAGGMPVVEYFVMPSGAIPSFSVEMLFPFKTSDGKTYDKVCLKTGTVIKLFDYQVGSQYLTWRGAREALNENLVETILPFRLLDFRQMPKTAEARRRAEARGGDRALGIDARPFYGMEYLLLRKLEEDDAVVDDGDADDADIHEAVGEKKLPVSTIHDPELGEILISAIPLRRGKLPGWLAGSNYRVLHAVNGQVQFKQTKGFLSQSCSLPALKDRIVIVVDASNLTFESHNEIWKGDREHIRETIVGQRYLDEIKTAIKSSDTLKKLQQQIAREEMETAVEAGQETLLQKLVDFDKNFAALLDPNSRNPLVRLPAAGSETGGDPGKGEFRGKISPTFLRMDEKQKLKGIAIPINRRRPAVARTDVENNYLQRVDNRGSLIVDELTRRRFSIHQQLLDGRLTLYLEPREGAVQVGDSFDFTIGLQDDGMAEPVLDFVTVHIVEEESQSGGKPKSKNEDHKKSRENGTPKSDGAGDAAATHGLPHFNLLTSDGRSIAGNPTEKWPEGFNEQDGGFAMDLGDQGSLFKINYDNVYHQKYRLSTRGDVAKEVVTQKYILGMLILMLGCERAFKNLPADSNAGEYADEFRKVVGRGAASTVLALAENLPKIIDASSVTATSDME